MYVKTAALAVAALAAGQAAATLDLLSGRPLSEAIFGLSSQQVRNVDSALSRAEKAVETSVANVYNMAAKRLSKIVADVDKNSSPAVSDAATALNKALTPDVKEKIKKAISSVVDSTLNAVL
ncbi:hypothetical protein IWQ56_001404 [Coemansia nantahalensis]|uniref:Uncharacterized protein n=1 Tax=Coemansia nantahalensis TaxID=2789366 RepID=A0ACC1JTQ9_9FUNG|nr:hypothetical protein IWQ57_004043 [Coemansia nantahalensis]KAJ2772369.1 hypothetical protein IWQ56_001404 [Coemansia nantahalensis]